MKVVKIVHEYVNLFPIIIVNFVSFVLSKYKIFAQGGWGRRRRIVLRRARQDYQKVYSASPRQDVQVVWHTRSRERRRQTTYAVHAPFFKWPLEHAVDQGWRHHHSLRLAGVHGKYYSHGHPLEQQEGLKKNFLKKIFVYLARCEKLTKPPKSHRFHNFYKII